MIEPRAQPGDLVYLRFNGGTVSGPHRVERVIITLNSAGRFDRFHLDVYRDPAGIDEERIHRTAEEAHRAG